VTSKRRDYGIGATTPVKIKQNRMSSFRTIQIAPNDKMMLGAARLYRLSNICERFANCRAAFQKGALLDAVILNKRVSKHLATSVGSPAS